MVGVCLFIARAIRSYNIAHKFIGDKKNILGIEIIPEQNKIFEDKIKII